jgi:hypothetical protein
MFLVGPKIFSFVVNGVKVIFLGVQRGWRVSKRCLGDLITRYNYNLTIMKSPKPATDTIYPHIKFKGVGVTIESYGKLEISYINVDNF